MKKQAFRTTLLVMLALLAGPAGASKPGGEGSRAHSTEVRPPVDETLVWNQVMLDAIVASTLGNPQTMRMAATVNTAMFDAQNGVGRPTYTPIFVTDRAPRGTHRRAAMVQAAYVTLKSFYPAQLSRFDEQRALSLAEFEGDDCDSSPARPRVGRARREPNPGLACDRRLQPIRCPRLPVPAQRSASGSPQPVPACRRATSPSQRRSC